MSSGANTLTDYTSPDHQVLPSDHEVGSTADRYNRVRQGLSVVAWNQYIDTYGIDSADKANSNGVVPPFESMADPLDTDIAQRDIGYVLDWMKWLASDANNKILSIKDCELNLGCIQKYAEFVLSTRQLPSRMPYDSMEPGVIVGTEERPQYYSTPNGTILTTAPKGAYKQGIHMPLGRVGGLTLSGENDESIREFFDKEADFSELRIASGLIEGRLYDLSEAAPGFYEYYKLLDRLHRDEGSSYKMDGHDEIQAKVEAVALLMKVLFPEISKDWGGDIIPDSVVEAFKHDIGMVDYDLGDRVISRYPRLPVTTVDTWRVGVGGRGKGGGSKKRSAEIPHRTLKRRGRDILPKDRPTETQRGPVYPEFNENGDLLEIKRGAIWANDTISSYPRRDSIPSGEPGFIDVNAPEYVEMVSYINATLGYLETLTTEQIVGVVDNAVKHKIYINETMYDVGINPPVAANSPVRVVGDAIAAPSHNMVDTEFANSRYGSTMKNSIENVFYRYDGVVVGDKTFEGPMVEIICNMYELMATVTNNEDIMRRYFDEFTFARMHNLISKIDLAKKQRTKERAGFVEYKTGTDR